MTQRVSNQAVWQALRGAGAALLDLARAIVLAMATFARLIAEVLTQALRIIIGLARAIMQVVIIGEVIGAALLAGGAVWSVYPGGIEKMILVALLTVTPIAYALRHPQRGGALQAAAIVLAAIGLAVNVFDTVGRVVLLLVALSVTIVYSQRQAQQESELNYDATKIGQDQPCLSESNQIRPGDLHGDPVDRSGHGYHASLDQNLCGRGRVRPGSGAAGVGRLRGAPVKVGHATHHRRDHDRG